MEKINFINNVTKANADTFNTMQDNIEDAIDEVDEKTLDIYSTSETRIGTWIDGKPLYRKTISGTTTGETNNILNIITGYNEVIKYNGTFKTPSGYITELPEYTNASNYIYFVLNTSNNVGILNIPSGFIGGTYNIVIEYTKTTD